MSDWITQSYNGMQYIVLLPQNYNPSQSYSATLYLHQLDNGSFGPQGLEPQINPWFNNSGNQSIIVAPLLDQATDPMGETINFGGVSTGDTAGENNAIGALKQVMSQYSVDPSRVYVTGNSMGGIGTWDMLVKYNAYTGTEGRIFAAGMPIAGNDYGQDPNQAASLLNNVPIWAFHGAQDTQVPLNWDRTLAARLAGSPTFHYTEDPNGGHDVWDETYGQGNGPGTALGWLDSQSTGGSSTPAPAPEAPPAAPQVNKGESADHTIITFGSGKSIVDSYGNVLTITDGDQLAANGYVDQTTHNVRQLVYLNKAVWQEASDGKWWAESGQPTPYGNGSTVSPLPEDQPQPASVTPVVSTPTQPAPAPSSGVGSSGSDSLTINAAGYAVQGVAPQFIVYMDGAQVGGVNTVTAIEFDGSQNGGNQSFTFSGDWGPGPHTVGVDYINNNVSPTGDDGNIFVNSVKFDGNTTIEYNPSRNVLSGFLYQNGTVNFTGIVGHI